LKKPKWNREGKPPKHSPRVNFIDVLLVHFWYESQLSSFSLLRVWLWMNFCTKNASVKCWWNWLLPISPAFYKQLFCQFAFSQKISGTHFKNRKSAQNSFYKKAASKMLMKSTLYSNLHVSSRFYERKKKKESFSSKLTMYLDMLMELYN